MLELWSKFMRMMAVGRDRYYVSYLTRDGIRSCLNCTDKAINREFEMNEV